MFVNQHPICECMKTKNKTNKKILVTVSALALRLAAAPSAAMAQLQISCPTPVNFGKFVACSTTGRYRLRPDGVTQIQSGCFIIKTAAMVGQCIIKNGGIPVTKSVQVTFTDNAFNATNGMGDDIKIQQFRMNTDGTGNNNKQTLTFPATAINNTVTINVGARIRLQGNNVVGTYVGVNRVRANELP